ncbi:hypothetical protein FRAAL0411 [Frankia alni ACN14a]|uniref:Uncharacterized protein n=1 Tax=Frankia alni (strain DSM 45986 / CECT 9034 / ACN14a) TaxID=326424 RepID=Q0RTL2_FRAAA|nr:hypothetical protein FRAAL0411 [Frankia alni ACN14a]
MLAHHRHPDPAQPAPDDTHVHTYGGLARKRQPGAGTRGGVPRCSSAADTALVYDSVSYHRRG